MAGPLDPLFRQASREVKAAARRSFAQTDFGRLVAEAKKGRSAAGRRQEYMRRALQTYRRDGAANALRSLMGVEFGRLAGEVARYAKRDGITKRLMNEFLDQLGPAGQILRAVSGAWGAASSLQRDLEAARKLLEAHGHLVIPPPGEMGPGELRTLGEQLGGVLQGMGFTVLPPEVQPPARTKPENTKTGRPGVVSIPMANGSTRQFPTSHPIVTGKMQRARNSTNVYSYGYDYESALLYVRFQQVLPGQNSTAYENRKRGPGPLYQYANVTPEEFLDMLRVNSKGDWVWDHLRVRGTASGHQKDYKLVGVVGDYVPRKATLFPDGREYFITRRIKTTSGRWLTSSRPPGPVPASYYQFGRPNGHLPDNGAPPGPNRGRPNDGRPGS